MSQALPSTVWKSGLSDCVFPYPQDGSTGVGSPEQFFNCAEGKSPLAYSVAVLRQRDSLLDNSFLRTVTILGSPSTNTDITTPAANTIQSTTQAPITAIPITAIPTSSPIEAHTTPTKPTHLCSGCYGTSSGPCKQDNGVCHPLVNGVCVYGTTPCIPNDTTPTTPTTPTHLCSGCYGTSSGPCKQANGVCHPLVHGVCVYGTTPCKA
jgi:hypothetical protein